MQSCHHLQLIVKDFIQFGWLTSFVPTNSQNLGFMIVREKREQYGQKLDRPKIFRQTSHKKNA